MSDRLDRAMKKNKSDLLYFFEGRSSAQSIGVCGSTVNIKAKAFAEHLYYNNNENLCLQAI